MDDYVEDEYVPEPPQRYPMDALFDGILNLLAMIEETPHQGVATLAEAVITRTLNSTFPLPSAGAGLKAAT